MSRRPGRPVGRRKGKEPTEHLGDRILSKPENGLSADQQRVVGLLAAAESNGADSPACDPLAGGEWLAGNPKFIAELNRAKASPEGAAPGRSPISGLRRNGDSPEVDLRPGHPSGHSATGLPDDPPSGRWNGGRRDRTDVGGGSQAELARKAVFERLWG